MKGNGIRAALIFFTVAAAMMSVPAFCAAAIINPEGRIKAATETARQLEMDPGARAFSEALSSAKGIAIFPNTKFDAVGLDGEGFVLSKEGGGWKGPSFASFSGGMPEYRAGVANASLVLIIRTDEGLAAFKDKKGFSFQGEYSAAHGAMDRTAVTEGHFLCYIVSSQFFDGMEFGGATLRVDGAANSVFWRKRLTPGEALAASADIRTEPLTSALKAISEKFRY
jgi:lipid-binding SYLF domain-containing protein